MNDWALKSYCPSFSLLIQIQIRLNHCKFQIIHNTIQLNYVLFLLFLLCVLRVFFAGWLFPADYLYQAWSVSFTPRWLTEFCHKRGIVWIVQWVKSGVEVLAFLSMEDGTRMMILARNLKHCRSSKTCWKIGTFSVPCYGMTIDILMFAKIWSGCDVFHELQQIHLGMPVIQWAGVCNLIRFALYQLKHELLGWLFSLKSQ